VAGLHPECRLFEQVTARTRHQRYDQPPHKASGSLRRARHHPGNNHLTQRGFDLGGWVTVGWGLSAMKLGW